MILETCAPEPLQSRRHWLIREYCQGNYKTLTDRLCECIQGDPICVLLLAGNVATRSVADSCNAADIMSLITIGGVIISAQLKEINCFRSVQRDREVRG